jgi:hypothetical protein
MTKPIEYQKQNKAPTDAAYQYNDSRIIEANTRRRHESQYGTGNPIRRSERTAKIQQRFRSDQCKTVSSFASSVELIWKTLMSSCGDWYLRSKPALTASP